jgi:hypothetical protein
MYICGAGGQWKLLRIHSFLSESQPRWLSRPAAQPIAVKRGLSPPDSDDAELESARDRTRCARARVCNRMIACVTADVPMCATHTQARTHARTHTQTHGSLCYSLLQPGRVSKCACACVGESGWARSVMKKRAFAHASRVLCATSNTYRMCYVACAMCHVLPLHLKERAARLYLGVQLHG